MFYVHFNITDGHVETFILACPYQRIMESGLWSKRKIFAAATSWNMCWTRRPLRYTKTIDEALKVFTIGWMKKTFQEMLSHRSPYTYLSIKLLHQSPCHWITHGLFPINANSNLAYFDGDFKLLTHSFHSKVLLLRAHTADFQFYWTLSELKLQM